MMGADVAAQTRHLRIGTAVSLAAFYHPLRLAEEVALLDYPRFREHVEIVIGAWRSERLTGIAAACRWLDSAAHR
jgi:alkanesulfonate monooxygenase SsuD/methylene tetrahydromethanopterin reductase-like flavin-dependent oxidoreductase (luciferase family)